MFGPVWTLIYTLTAASAVLAWEACPSRSQRRLLLLAFLANALLNIAWSWLFFHAPAARLGPHRIRRTDRLGGALDPCSLVDSGRWPVWLLLPYLLWVSFAGWLNCSVVRHQCLS